MTTTQTPRPPKGIHHNQRPWIDRRLIGDVEYVPIDSVKPYPGNPRKHPKRQQKKIDQNLPAFGIVLPILIDPDNTIVAGEAIHASAKRLEYTEIPVLRIEHLSAADVKALRIALNRLAELADWGEGKLAIEFQHLLELDYDIELTGFEMPEIDLVIDGQLAPVGSTPADELPAERGPQVSQVGDLWFLDEHRVLCDDARDPQAYETVLDGRSAQTVITDPPYNVRVQGHVGGSGAIKHGEFVMASGEMSEEEYEAFLVGFIRNLVRYSEDGSVHYLFIDWRHLHVLEAVCHRYYGRQLNLCIWAKSNGGMGSFYRSQHELVLVFKKGDAPHINNVQLGKYGRNRSNVWAYDGCNSLSPDRRADLKLHPTVKPVAMIADAIRDSSKRGGLVLDPFLGSGTAVIACEQTGRICAGLELDPGYMDVIVRRWEAFTGNQARHAATGMTFEGIGEMRNGGQLLLPPPSNEGEA